jgi:hypothetical protein
MTTMPSVLTVSMYAIPSAVGGSSRTLVAWSFPWELGCCSVSRARCRSTIPWVSFVLPVLSFCSCLRTTTLHGHTT